VEVHLEGLLVALGLCYLGSDLHVHRAIAEDCPAALAYLALAFLALAYLASALAFASFPLATCHRSEASS